MPSNSARRLLLCFLIILMPQISNGTPAQSTVLYREGTELFKKGDISAAEQKFMESVKLSPSYSLAHYGLGRVYLMNKDKTDDAIKSFRRSVELDPGLAKGYFYLGLAEFIGGKYQDALHSFKAAYERDRGYVEALYNMGVIYDLLGKNYMAFVYYRQYFNEKEK